MRTTSAYEAIHDPLDPAWIGHAVEPSQRAWWRGRVAVFVAIAAVLVVVVVVAAMSVGGGDGRDGDRAPRDEASTSTVRPSAVIASDAAGVPAPEAPVAAPAARAPKAATPPVARPASSGWAPAAATIAPEDAGSGMLEGDLAGVSPELIRRLDALAVTIGREIEVISGWRTRHEQEDLYDSFLSGAGNLAAVPGTSNHETGRAADVYVDGVALAAVDGVEAQAAALGLHFPVAGEAWHVEMTG